MATHGACGRSWSGMRAEHCGSCHETFTGRTSGDLHRAGPFDGDRRCLSMAEMREAGLHLNDRGLWALPAVEGAFDWASGV